MSITQGANWMALSGVIVILLKFFGIEVVEADVQTLIGSVIAIVSIVVNYYNRYKKGDLTTFGAYKPSA